MDVKEIVMKLVGPIDPVGESHTDTKRLENLKELNDVILSLMAEVEGVLNSNESVHEYSRKEAANKARKLIRMMKGRLEDYDDDDLRDR